MSCQPEDSVASTLAQRLLAAIEGTDPPRSVEATVDLIEAGIWRRSPTPTVLLLDDAHLISSGSPGARLLAALVDRLPATGHLLLAGRPPLPLPTARLAALGQAVQLDERELAFDGDELIEFATLRGVPPDLVQRTGGWPALAELTAVVGEQQAVDFLWSKLAVPAAPARRRLLAALAVVGGGDEEGGRRARRRPSGTVRWTLVGLPLLLHRPGWRWRHGLVGAGVGPAADRRRS